MGWARALFYRGSPQFGLILLGFQEAGMVERTDRIALAILDAEAVIATYGEVWAAD